VRQIASLLSCCVIVALTACDSDKATNPLDPNASNLGTMSVGDVRVLQYSQTSGGLKIPANLSSAQYLIVAANATVTTDVIPQLTVSGSWQAPSSRGLSADQRAPRVTYTSVGGKRGATFEGQLRTFERKALANRRAIGSPLAPRASRNVPAPKRAIIAPTLGATGTIKTLTPAAFSGSANICSASSYTTETGTVRAVTAHAIVVSDNRITSGFSNSEYQAIADEFESIIYPTDVGYFGTPSDVDNNGGRVVIFYTPSVNLQTPPGTADASGYVGGYFFAGDLFDVADCATSNEGEIFYLLAPDPGATYGNDFTLSFVRDVTRGTVGHEFQHMINAGGRFVGNADAFEATWLDEGLAHFAEDAVGRAAAGFADLQKITLTNFNTIPQTIQDGFFLQNLSRAKYYVMRPDTTGAIVSDTRAGQNLASRGAEWLLLRYAADWLSNDNPRALMKKLVVGPDTGSVNLAKATGVPVDTILARWLVTLYTDHRSIPNLNSQYEYRSYEMRPLVSAVTGIGSLNAYLPVTAVGDGATSATIGIPPSSAAYFITSKTTGGARTINVSATTGTQLSGKGRFYVVRLQ
jgi:hypothetical protein